MAKEFAFEQIFRNGRGVDGNKRLTGARRVLVQRVCHQLFARPRLASDEHRDMALRQPANATKHILHGRGLAQHFRGFGEFFFSDIFALAFAYGASNQLDRFGQVKGFRQVFKCATGEGRDRAVQIRKRGHDDDRQTRHALLDGGQQVES